MDFKDENNSSGGLVDGAIILDEEINKNQINNNNYKNDDNDNYSSTHNKTKDSSSNLLNREDTYKRYGYQEGEFNSENNQNNSEHSSLNKKGIRNLISPISPHLTSSSSFSNINDIDNNSNSNINENDNEITLNNDTNKNNDDKNNYNNNNLEGSSGFGGENSIKKSISSGYINENNLDNLNNNSNILKNFNNHDHFENTLNNNNLESNSIHPQKNKIQKKIKKLKKSKNAEKGSNNSKNNLKNNNFENKQQQQASENSIGNSTINSEQNKVIFDNSLKNSNNNFLNNQNQQSQQLQKQIKMELSDPISDQQLETSTDITTNSDTLENDNNTTSTSLNNSNHNSVENSPKLKPQETSNTTDPTTTTTTTNTTTTTLSPLEDSNNTNNQKVENSNLKVEYRNEPEEYDRQQFYEYRDDHRENGEHGEPSIKTEEDLNKKYSDFNEGKRLKNLSYWLYFKFLFNKNKYKWDINQNKRFYLAAQIITRFGFLSKTILYCSLGVLSIAAAVDKERSVQGPDGVFEELQEMFSGGVIILLLLGLWSYGCWGIFYIVFDVDQLGHKGAGPILKRFGRIFSSGFYFVLGVDAARVVAHTRKQESGTSHILGFLYKYVFGKIIVCVLGVTFFVVSLVYLIYFIKPDKFKRELSTERMNKYLYWSALGFARIGAVGRSMFFGAFGGVLIKAVADINKGKEADTSLLGFQGVFQQIANYNTTLLFIIAILIMFYALWCFWLMFFRRLPAHQDAKYAREVLGSAIDKKYVFNGILFRILKNYEDQENDQDVNDLSEYNEHHANDVMSPSLSKNIPFKQNVDNDNNNNNNQENLDGNTFNYYVENQKEIPSNIDKTYNI
ncbi:hypothetical protein DICPUDRAFT_151820 [Dictyostelium purpureum]|uniref:DUF1206 domain-containing protein n=1 Tax=Dictyostelium purpureum TaxID=5786 RepID=F0ZJU2_DICPU|nr:uncharacterized protein DICPUDRAFT_151820 [Dictyostelium purpureum]EGC35798.1 hypothetical protein DICPUDRAFT_151820 [Dictyostelium purpureum]|eukprot:XP_003287692.1 hypothetical protein DICPUDRAFT_151820 [Dictyostelium purpureum]